MNSLYHCRTSSLSFVGRRLFCRLFDDSLNELISPFETTVFPEFTVNCLASESATFVALSFNPDDPINKSDVQALRIHNGKTTHTKLSCSAQNKNGNCLLDLILFRHYRLVQGWSFFLREAELFGDFNHTEVHRNIIVALERKVMERLQLTFPNKTT
uniref:Uncharacterized protein n=1 Tax=Heterorhabditis bacteriophora TaxID=37862 RepID=A0A1I7XQG1_HETBA